MTDAPPLRRRSLLAAGLAAAAAPARAAPSRGWPVVELRQYTLHAGRRDELIDLFEREFIDSQAAVGAHVLGTFRDLDDPDRFVWLRGFPSLPERAKALAAFYGGPVWKAHREAANATMLDSANVLLLRPAQPGGGFDPDSRAAPPGEILAFIHDLDDALIPPFADWWRARLRPAAEAAGARVLAAFVTEPGPNTFPALPVRERDRVFAWFARLPAGGEAAFLARWRAKTGWRDGAADPLLPAFMKKPELLRLSPTARSPLG